MGLELIFWLVPQFIVSAVAVALVSSFLFLRLGSLRLDQTGRHSEKFPLESLNIPQGFSSCLERKGLTQSSQVGFFLGPLFPAAVVAATKSLPKHLHVSTIGFAAAFGGGGGAVLPFAVGAIAQSKGVGVLQPIISSLIAVLFCLWLALPNFNRKRD